jgi:hypothetical protein
MADKKPETAPAPEADASAKPAKSGALKTVILLVVVMILEGAAIVGTMSMGGGPKEANAELTHGAGGGGHGGGGHGGGHGEAGAVDPMAIVELQVASGKYPNLRTGRSLLYDTEVYLTVHKKDEENTKKILESSKAQIAMEIVSIMRKGEPSFFQEATLTTLRRQFKAVLDEKIGKDAKGEPIVQDVLITKCTPLAGY